MTLDYFCKKQKEKIDNFERQWREGNSKNKKDFPLAMGDRDWDEQFDIFMWGFNYENF